MRSSSRVSTTRMPNRASIAPLTRRATASTRSFSFVPPAPFTPSSSPPWPGSMAMTRKPRPPGRAPTGRAAERRVLAPAPAAARQAASVCAGIKSMVRRVELVERLGGGAEAAEPRTEIDGEGHRFDEADRLHQRLRLKRRDREVERVGLELDRGASCSAATPSSRSAATASTTIRTASPPSSLIVTRGTRQSPTMSSRDGFRRSRRES